ncbi:MAG: RNA-binding domain-containing protein [Deferrisomatales bacterium]
MSRLTALEIQELAEDQDLEVKRATGRDGRGELPRSFFESYVAMANTGGGVVFLGIEEKPRGTLTVVGIQDVDPVLKALWDGLNDRDRVSANLLTNEMVEVIDVEGRSVIRIRVPRAPRQQRPVYVGANPLRGTYRRNYDGDYRCDEETVRRLLAEQVEDSRDSKLLEHYGLDDLDDTTLKSYRNQFRTTRPDHPWLDLDDKEFLRSLGAWARERQTGAEGLTVAGLLMFGRLRSILDAVPNYVVDYRELPEAKDDVRWVDRVTTDGSWSGNLYDFYRKVIQKLTSEIRVPFRLRGAERIDSTPVHEALREALTNALIHADYSGRVPTLILKAPGIFAFRNPGVMRVPLAEAIRGGVSDCRNRNLQKMFQLAGLGEQAGSGIPRIFRSWRRQDWRSPEFSEKVEPEQTILRLRMVHLLPDETVQALQTRFGARFGTLSEVQRLALATVAIEGKVDHARLRAMTSEHPHDITKALSALVRDDFLESSGATRATFYFFPGEEPGRDLDGRHPVQEELLLSSEHSDPSSQHNGPSSQHNGPSSQRMDAGAEQVGTQLVESAAVAKVRSQGRVAPHVMAQAIAELCEGRFVPIKDLAEALSRSPDTLGVHYLPRMVKQKVLELRYPERVNHPQQAYRTRRP